MCLQLSCTYPLIPELTVILTCAKKIMSGADYISFFTNSRTWAIWSLVALPSDTAFTQALFCPDIDQKTAHQNTKLDQLLTVRCLWIKNVLKLSGLTETIFCFYCHWFCSSNASKHSDVKTKSRHRTVQILSTKKKVSTRMKVQKRRVFIFSSKVNIPISQKAVGTPIQKSVSSAQKLPV